MAISSKDIETLWGRYQSEGVSKGVSVSQYFEANGIPYHVFEKWYKKRYRQPDVVECVVDGTPNEDQQSCPTPCSNDKTVAQGLALKNSVTVSHVNISQKPQYLLGLWCIVIGIGCLHYLQKNGEKFGELDFYS